MSIQVRYVKPILTCLTRGSFYRFTFYEIDDMELRQLLTNILNDFWTCNFILRNDN